MTDVLIIGSGPAGMSAAIYAKRANLNVLIVEKEYEGTGQMAESSRSTSDDQNICHLFFLPFLYFLLFRKRKKALISHWKAVKYKAAKQ